jgi:predicted phosphodiesterase
MRIAVVSDIHGNRTAFEAVLADLRLTAPDLILHGGDLADSGSSPVEVVDRIRDLSWQGVLGNTDEMLFEPGVLAEFSGRASEQLKPMFAAIEEMAAATRVALGEERLAWLRGQPLVQKHGPLALVHGTPESPWRAPEPAASDAELEAAYAPLGRPSAVYGHIHRSFVRRVPRESGEELIVVNTGSVSLSYDGDPRAAYLLLDGLEPTIRRVEYALDAELKALTASGLPHAEWVARMLISARFEMP